MGYQAQIDRGKVVKLIIDTDTNSLSYQVNDQLHTISLYSKAAFEILTQQWIKVGWNQKYTYTFNWLGRPIIQLPEDLLRIQEVIYQLKPDVIIETGIAHGGSLIFYASLLRVMGKGKIIGIDIEIRPHNRRAIEAHELFPMITLIEGDSIAKDTVRQVKSLVEFGDVVMVVLDSNHTKEHVLAELEVYHEFVTRDSYIVATDGIMQYLYDVPRGHPDWKWNNPAAAAVEFVKKHPEFQIEQPPWSFNESDLDTNVTHWPDAWLKKIS